MGNGGVGRVLSVVLLSCLVGTGCYHATITTTRPQSGTVVEEKWAHSFLWGLVPPSTVETASQCPNGVARVETQHSFLNGLAAALTWGIYTPIQIQAWCAGPGEEDRDAQVMSVPENANPEDVQRTFAAAAAYAARTGDPVFVHLANAPR